MSNPDPVPIRRLRLIHGCEKHMNISAELKKIGHIDTQFSDSAIYWANVCDDCANQIVVGQKC